MTAPDTRHTDPATSHQAAADNRPRRATQRTRALNAFALQLAYPTVGFTDFELADRLGIQQTSAGKRRLELQRLDFVREAHNTDRGGCLTREAPSGSLATVWEITRAGLAHWYTGEPVPMPPEGPTRERVAEFEVTADRVQRTGEQPIDAYTTALAHVGEGQTVRLVVEVER